MADTRTLVERLERFIQGRWDTKDGPPKEMLIDILAALRTPAPDLRALLEDARFAVESETQRAKGTLTEGMGERLLAQIDAALSHQGPDLRPGCCRCGVGGALVGVTFEVGPFCRKCWDAIKARARWVETENAKADGPDLRGALEECERLGIRLADCRLGDAWFQKWPEIGQQIADIAFAALRDPDSLSPRPSAPDETYRCPTGCPNKIDSRTTDGYCPTCGEELLVS